MNNKDANHSKHLFGLISTFGFRLLESRPNKKIRVFWVTGLKILSRVKAHNFFFWKKYNFMCFERHFALTQVFFILAYDKPTCYMQKFNILASLSGVLAEQAGLSFTWLDTLKTDFLMTIYLVQKHLFSALAVQLLANS